jgi:hypothetical protein
MVSSILSTLVQFAGAGLFAITSLAVAAAGGSYADRAGVWEARWLFYMAVVFAGMAIALAGV